MDVNCHLLKNSTVVDWLVLLPTNFTKEHLESKSVPVGTFEFYVTDPLRCFLLIKRQVQVRTSEMQKTNCLLTRLLQPPIKLDKSRKMILLASGSMFLRGGKS
jgi:hypothetical protein